MSSQKIKCWSYSENHDAYVLHSDEENILKRPFIKHYALHGFAEYQNKYCEHFSVALMNEETMRLLDIKDNDYIHIEDADIVLQVLSGPVNLEKVMVPLNFILPHKITLRPFSGFIRKATCIFYELRPDTSRRSLLSLYISQKMSDLLFVRKNSNFEINFLGTIHEINVVNVYTFRNSDDFIMSESDSAENNLVNKLSEIHIDSNKQIQYHKSSKWDVMPSSTRPNLSDVIGYDSQINRIRQCVVSPLEKGMKPRSIVLYGPPGCGKSFIAKALCNELHRYFSNFWYTNPLVLPVPANTVIVLHPISLHSTSTLVEMFESEKALVVVGIINRIDDVPVSLRRANRFEVEIEIPLPTASQRLTFLKSRCDAEENLDLVAEATLSYSFTDLVSLIREASTDSLMNALKRVCPAVIQDVITEIPKVFWSDIGGLEFLKQQLTEMLIWPFAHSLSFERLGIIPPRGILLYGPPGCSKTLICRAIATETNLNFLSIRGPELFTKWVGDSEKAIRNIFSRAEQASPCIIFFDEIDALARERGTSQSECVSDRVVAQMLTEMDGIKGRKSQVLFVAATNRPDFIDPALLRPGRFDRCIYVPLPDAKTREEIFKIKFRQMPVSSDVSLAELVQETDMYSGADIVALCNEAGILALGDNSNTSSVSAVHFNMALKIVFSRTTKEDLIKYELFAKQTKQCCF